MREIVYDDQAGMLQWAEGHIEDCRFRPDACAIGHRNNGKYLGVCVFDSHTTTGCWISVASDQSKRWITRDFIISVFAYPFLQCNYPRLNSFVSENNAAAIRFNEHFGFKREGLMRGAGVEGEDLIMYGMLKSECRWLPRIYRQNAA